MPTAMTIGVAIVTFGIVTIVIRHRRPAPPAAQPPARARSGSGRARTRGSHPGLGSDSLRILGRGSCGDAAISEAEVITLRTTTRVQLRGRRFSLILASTLVLVLTAGSLPARASAAPSGGTSYQARTFDLKRLAWDELYPTLKKLPPVATDGPSDADGVPMRLWDGQLYYSPTGIAMRANQRLVAYRQTRGNRAYLDVVSGWAAKLRDLAVPGNGALWLPFTYDNRNERLAAPWYNALGQGAALALFSRLYRLLHVPAYLSTATGLFHGFELLGPSTDPWVGHVDPNGYLWLEHYAGGYLGRVLSMRTCTPSSACTPTGRRPTPTPAPRARGRHHHDAR